MKQYFLHITVFILLGLATSCKKEPTSWNTGYMVPLVEGRLDPGYLFDNNLANENNDSSLQIKWVKEIVDYSIDSLYEVPDTALSKDFSIALNSITAPAGFQFFTDNDDLEFDISNGVQLKTVGFADGSININVNNPVETDIFVTLDLPGVVKDGNPLSIFARVPKAVNGVDGSFDTLVSLKNTQFDLSGSTGSLTNKLASNIILQTDPNGSGVTITNNDLFTTTISLGELETNYAKGYFGQHILDVDDHFIVSFLKKFTSGSLDINNLDFKLKVINGFKLIASSNIARLEGFNTRTGSDVSFIHPQLGTDININPAIGGWENLQPSQYQLSISDVNSNVTNFISVIPDSIDFSVSATINPLGNVSGGNDVAYPNSRFILEADLEFPAQLSLNQLVFEDTLEVSFERDVNKSHLNTFILEITTVNSLPMNGRLGIELLDETGNRTVIDDQLIIKSPAILANGKTNSSVENTAQFELSPENLGLLAQENTKLIIKAMMETEQSEEQIFYSNQYINYTIRGNAGIQIKF